MDDFRRETSGPTESSPWSSSLSLEIGAGTGKKAEPDRIERLQRRRRTPGFCGPFPTRSGLDAEALDPEARARAIARFVEESWGLG